MLFQSNAADACQPYPSTALMTRMFNTVVGRCYGALPTDTQTRIDWLRGSPIVLRLVRGSFWSLSGSIVSRLLGLAATVLAARLLGKGAYGELGIIQSTVGMFGTLAGFGMGTTATKCVAEYRLKDPGKAGRVIGLSSAVSWGMSGLLGIVLVFAAPWLSRYTLAAPQLTGQLQLGALLLVLNGVNGAQNGALAGFEAFRSIARVSAFAGLLNFPLVVGGAFLYGLNGVVAGLILAQALGCFMSLLALREEATRHNVRISYSSWKEEAPIIWHFSLPAVLGGLLISPATWACNAMLVRQVDGYNHMGALNAANQWFGALTWLPYMLGGVILPLLSERLGVSDKARSVKLLKASVALNLVIASPIVLAGCLLSPHIMAAYGSGFGREWPTLAAMLFAAGVLAVQIPVGEILAAAGRMWVGLLLNLGWSLVLVFTAWSLLAWGAFGLAVAQLAAYSAQGVLGVFSLRFLIRDGE